MKFFLDIRKVNKKKIFLNNMVFKLDSIREKYHSCEISVNTSCALTNIYKHHLEYRTSAIDLGIPADSPNLVLLFFVAQLFLRELYKAKNLVRIVPMDMSGYYASKSGPSNIGNVISSILLCKPITPNFNEEELCSIRKDSAEISNLIAELQEFMPQSEADVERSIALQDGFVSNARSIGPKKGTRWDNRGGANNPNYFGGNSFNFLCCASRPNYV
ncbi:uncharacterized protein LOC122857873 isoform X3 [Aphidius gifuensis]|uniref:uncharacterized protein LOC122857873 isoform X3 n=1 Tax=Aphidius gifuensis TaxID=684658 RepID=UPI001CDCEF13|nr:uncharacterized protein LOC122857873 isoform X3 [Aphidius gifuensis]